MCSIIYGCLPNHWLMRTDSSKTSVWCNLGQNASPLNWISVLHSFKLQCRKETYFILRCQISICPDSIMHTQTLLNTKSPVNPTACEVFRYKPCPCLHFCLQNAVKFTLRIKVFMTQTLRKRVLHVLFFVNKTIQKSPMWQNHLSWVTLRETSWKVQR